MHVHSRRFAKKNNGNSSKSDAESEHAKNSDNPITQFYRPCTACLTNKRLSFSKNLPKQSFHEHQ